MNEFHFFVFDPPQKISFLIREISVWRLYSHAVWIFYNSRLLSKYSFDITTRWSHHLMTWILLNFTSFAFALISHKFGMKVMNFIIERNHWKPRHSHWFEWNQLRRTGYSLLSQTHRTHGRTPSVLILQTTVHCSLSNPHCVCVCCQCACGIHYRRFRTSISCGLKKAELAKNWYDSSRQVGSIKQPDSCLDIYIIL